MKDEKDPSFEVGKIRIIKPFGPSIAWTKIPPDLVEKLNSYIDKIVEDKTKSGKLDYGNKLVGDVTQEFILEKKFAEEVGWENFLKRGVAAWLEFAKEKRITKFDLINSWVVRQFKGEYNPVHWHGGHISGVGYLKVPKSFGEPIQKGNKRENSNGHLELIHGTKMFLSDSIIKFKPEVGNFYFFPNYMMHTVYPFTGTDEERRSISFNARIDADVYNVYGG